MLKTTFRHHSHLSVCSTLEECQVFTKVAMRRYYSINIYAAGKKSEKHFPCAFCVVDFFLQRCEWSPNIESQLTKLLVKNWTWIFSLMQQECDLLHGGKGKKEWERGFFTTWLRWELLLPSTQMYVGWIAETTGFDRAEVPFCGWKLCLATTIHCPLPTNDVEELRRFWQCNLKHKDNELSSIIPKDHIGMWLLWPLLEFFCQMVVFKSRCKNDRMMWVWRARQEKGEL